MFRTSWLSTLMSSAVCALVATSAIGEAVFAQIPGQRRVIYKISDINQFDADRFCRGRYENIHLLASILRGIVLCVGHGVLPHKLKRVGKPEQAE
jgi:hypothetical protein